MAKRTSKHTSRRVSSSGKFPFEVTTQMHFYLPICDYEPYAAFLLEQCHVEEILSLKEYERKQRKEQERLEAMSPEEREKEIERINDEGVDAWNDRMLNDYNDESWLNEEEDAREGANGIFDLCIPYLARKFPEEQEKEGEQKLIAAYGLLSQKGFLRNVSLSEQLDHAVIEGALRACYPAIFTREENPEKQERRREATKVQYHVNMAKRLGLPATLTLPDWEATLVHFDWKCAYCGIAPYTVLEHVQPMIAGGGTTPFNCVPACAECNLLKHDTPPEFLPSTFDSALKKIQNYLKEKKYHHIQKMHKREV